MAIISLLRSKGYTVNCEHILNADESKIRLETREKRIAFQKQLKGWITNSLFVVVEASFPSISVGYEISLALRMGKPVLILYSEGDPPSLLASTTNDNLVCERYTLDSVQYIIDGFINYIRGANDSRFTFFITPSIAHYLDEIARQRKMPKAMYLRSLIEQDMKKNEAVLQ